MSLLFLTDIAPIHSRNVCIESVAWLRVHLAPDATSASTRLLQSFQDTSPIAPPPQFGPATGLYDGPGTLDTISYVNWANDCVGTSQAPLGATLMGLDGNGSARRALPTPTDLQPQSDHTGIHSGYHGTAGHRPLG